MEGSTVVEVVVGSTVAEVTFFVDGCVARVVILVATSVLGVVGDVEVSGFVELDTSVVTVKVVIKRYTYRQTDRQTDR